MANQDAAISYMLGFEDSTLSSTITTSADGKRTRFGIDEHYHPELTNCLFYSSMGNLAALEIAKNVYREQYCSPLCIEEIANQDIANKLLSLGVNIGIHPVSKMLQSSVGVAEDGVIGVQTLLALSRENTKQVLADLCADAERFYIADVAQYPEKQEFLAGWLRRARA